VLVVKRDHTLDTNPTANTMKLYIAFENTGSSERVSAQLQARGLNFLKASPSDFPIVGFTERPQPGYESYKENISAFLLAQALKAKLPLYREGYFLQIDNARLIPLILPRIFIAFKDDKDSTNNALSKYAWETYRKVGKGISGTLPFATGLLQKIAKLPERNNDVQAPYGSVSFESYPELVQILRIFSQFFRTHSYPAYDLSQNDSPVTPTENIIGEKRKLDDAEFGEEVGDKVKAIKLTVDGAPLWVHAAPDDADVVLKYAKPNNTAGVKPWGKRSDVPATDGILFPYESDLSKDDKNMVPYILERYFLQSLGKNVEEINARFSKLVGRWRRDIHTSEIGHVLSHLAIGIKVALPCQARVFPIIENNRYFGFYLGGAHYSLGLKGKLFHPISFENNTGDITALSTHDEIINKIVTMMTGNDAKTTKEKTALCTSMLGVRQMLRGYNQTPNQIAEISQLVASLQFTDTPLPCTFDNIKDVLRLSAEKAIPKQGYIHHAAVLSNDPLSLQLSRFGIAVPSPDIPGASKTRIPTELPKELPKGSYGFRKTSLETAVFDWREMVKTGSVLNGPTQLNSRFQHVMSKDKKDKEAWFRMLMDYRKSTSDAGIGSLISGMLEGDGEKVEVDSSLAGM
jgi:hypothetical protein